MLSELDLAYATYSAMQEPPGFVYIAERLMNTSGGVRKRLVEKTPPDILEKALAYLASPEALRERERRMEWMRADPVRITMLKVYYRANLADFIHDWGVTSDPREIATGKMALVPFHLWPKQREMINWMISCWRQGRPASVVKGRDVGASWCAMALLCAWCIFEKSFAGGIGSATELKLDRSGDPDTLMWKAREFLKHLPEEFRGGYDEQKNSHYLRLTFPETGSSITGEAGDNIGRGGRKAQPNQTLIPTLNGWRQMGSLQVGEYVFGRNGRPTKIIATQPQGIVPIYQVRFDDGTSTKCCGDHLWHVVTKHQRKNAARRVIDNGTAIGRKKPLYSVMSTRELIELGVTVPRPDGQIEYRYQTPQCDPVQYAGKNLPIHPYLLGVLLGDGSITQNVPKLTSADIEIVARVMQVLPEGVTLSKSDEKYGWAFGMTKQGRAKKSPLRVALEDLDLYGKGSADKFIPRVYLQGSIEQRLELLRGLIDTDGWISERGANGSRVGFLSTSHHLLEGVIELVQSLGGFAGWSWKKGAMMSYPNGHKKWFDGCFELRIATPMNPAYLSRKAEKWKPRRKYALARSIVSIEPVSPDEATCITVEADDGLYLTNDYIVTHNSAYVIDEAAFLDRPQLVDASLSMNTNCRIDISTPHGVNSFFDRVHNPALESFSLNWRDDPRKDRAWYEKKKSETDPVVFAQEIDASFYASAEGILIPPQWVQAAVNLFAEMKIEPTGLKTSALDVADLGKDRCAWIFRNGNNIEHAVSWTGTGSDIHGTTAKAFVLCDMYGVEEMVFDANGVGAGVRAAARVLNEERIARGQKPIVVLEYVSSNTPLFPDRIVPGTNRKAKDMFLNRAAQSAWHLRGRFENAYKARNGEPYDAENLIGVNSAIPELSRMIAEFSQPQVKETASGKWQLVKTPPGTRSPNFYDSIAMGFSIMKRPMFITEDVLIRAARAGSDMLTAVLGTGERGA